MSFCKGFTQGGSNADVVIADAFIKNLTEGIDWTTAYEAVVSDAEGKDDDRSGNPSPDDRAQWSQTTGVSKGAGTS